MKLRNTSAIKGGRMMSENFVIGIDNGSQSTKVIIYDMEGNDVAYGSHKLAELVSQKPGEAVHPNDDLWDSVYHALKNV